MNQMDYMIFSDASLGNNKRYPEKVCAYSVAVLNLATNKYAVLTEFLGEHTINYGEMYGIYRGFQILNTVTKNLDRNIKVAVVSDSKVSITTLSDYVYRWDKRGKIWKRTNGEPVKNQKLIQFIYDKFIDNPKFSIKFIHMNSHKSYDDVGYMIKRLEKHYHISLNKKTAETFIDLNALVDKNATSMRKSKAPIEGCRKIKRKKDVTWIY